MFYSSMYLFLLIELSPSFYSRCIIYSVLGNMASMDEGEKNLEYYCIDDS